MTDEAKRCIAALRVQCRERDSCAGCAKDDYCTFHGDEALHDLAADLIESSTAELERVKRERDAAVESMRGWCTFCVHDERGKLLRESPVCLACMHNMDDEDLEDNWQWRGVQEEHK